MQKYWVKLKWRSSDKKSFWMRNWEATNAYRFLSALSTVNWQPQRVLREKGGVPLWQLWRFAYFGWVEVRPKMLFNRERKQTFLFRLNEKGVLVREYLEVNGYAVPRKRDAKSISYAKKTEEPEIEDEYPVGLSGSE